MCCMYTVYSGMQEWVIQIPSIPILVSVLFPSLHLKYFRIKFLLLVDIGNEFIKGSSHRGSLLDNLFVLMCLLMLTVCMHVLPTFSTWPLHYTPE